MTPEERLTRIENVIKALAESQVHHEAMMEKQSAAIERQNAAIEKQNSAIRDLIMVSRTLLDSQKTVTDQIQELGKAQRRTEGNVNTLAASIDRFIKSLRGRNGDLPSRKLTS
jgi:hypothetical protein